MSTNKIISTIFYAKLSIILCISHGLCAATSPCESTLEHHHHIGEHSDFITDAIDILKSHLPHKKFAIDSQKRLNNIHTNKAGAYGVVVMFPAIGYVVKYSTKKEDRDDFTRFSSLIGQVDAAAFSFVPTEKFYASSVATYDSIQLMPYAQGNLLVNLLTTEDAGDVLSKFGKALGEFQVKNYDAITQTTMTHGDLHAGNIFATDDGRFSLIDCLTLNKGASLEKDPDYFCSMLTKSFQRLGIGSTGYRLITCFKNSYNEAIKHLESRAPVGEIEEFVYAARNGDESAFQKLTEYSQDPRVAFAIGKIHLDRKEYSNSVPYFEQAIEGGVSIAGAIMRQLIMNSSEHGFYLSGIMCEMKADYTAASGHYGRSVHLPKSFERLKKLAEIDVTCRWQLGTVYEEGKGGNPKDIAEAIRLYEGSPIIASYLRLGAIYKQSDLAKALEYYCFALADGHAPAQKEIDAIIEAS